MFILDSIFNNSPKKPEKGASFAERRKFIKTKQEMEKDPFSYAFRTSFAKYINKPILKKSAKLEYARPLSILQDQEIKTFSKDDSNKMLSPDQGGPTKEQIYNSALNLAKQLGWQEKPFEKDLEREDSAIDTETKKQTSAQQGGEDLHNIFSANEAGIPVFITNRLRRDLNSFGISDDEIDQMKPFDAWNILQQKTLERDILNIGKEKKYKTEELSEDFSILQKMWNEAYDKMDDVNEHGRTIEILDLTAKSFDDPESLEKYLKDNGLNLKPEERFFIEMSIQVKKFRARAKELLYNKV